MIRRFASRAKISNQPHVSRAIRYEIQSPRCALQVVDCSTHDHAWSTIVLEWEHFGEPICFDFNASDLDAVSDMLNAARAMLRMK
jgi:hypothetical protein